MLLDELRDIIEKLNNIDSRLKYLTYPIAYESILHLNSSGRYETEKGDYYTCGSGIEALIYDKVSEKWKWIWSSVEIDENGYYIVYYKDVKLDGLRVRRRKLGRY